MNIQHLLAEEGYVDQVETTDVGMMLSRRVGDDPVRFAGLVRRLIEGSGPDYVALPLAGGRSGYDGVFIIPFDRDEPDHRPPPVPPRRRETKWRRAA